MSDIKKAIQDIQNHFKHAPVPDSFNGYMSIDFLKTILKRKGDSETEIQDTVDFLRNGGELQFENGMKLRLVSMEEYSDQGTHYEEL